MFIVPIAPITPIDSLKSVTPVTPNVPIGQSSGGRPATGFAGVLHDAIASVNQTDDAMKKNAAALATGDMDDLHTLQIESQKASLALDTVIAFRNKLMDAYTEIMRINL